MFSPRRIDLALEASIPGGPDLVERLGLEEEVLNLGA
jgi:hypothetical protein